VRAPRAELIAEVMLALTDTSREDFDVAELLYALTTACLELFDVDAAGMLLVDEQGRLVPVAATDDGSEHLERLQIMTREGPCLDAVRGVHTVRCNDLDQEAERWPESWVAGRVGVGGSGRRDLDRDRRAGPVYEPLGAVGGQDRGRRLGRRSRRVVAATARAGGGR
jgi:hypothetical protein